MNAEALPLDTLANAIQTRDLAMLGRVLAARSDPRLQLEALPGCLSAAWSEALPVLWEQRNRINLSEAKFFSHVSRLPRPRKDIPHESYDACKRTLIAIAKSPQSSLQAPWDLAYHALAAKRLDLWQDILDSELNFNGWAGHAFLMQVWSSQAENLFYDGITPETARQVWHDSIVPRTTQLPTSLFLGALYFEEVSSEDFSRLLDLIPTHTTERQRGALWMVLPLVKFSSPERALLFKQALEMAGVPEMAVPDPSLTSIFECLDIQPGQWERLDATHTLHRDDPNFLPLNQRFRASEAGWPTQASFEAMVAVARQLPGLHGQTWERVAHEHALRHALPPAPLQGGPARPRL